MCIDELEDWRKARGEGNPMSDQPKEVREMSAAFVGYSAPIGQEASFMDNMVKKQRGLHALIHNTGSSYPWTCSRCHKVFRRKPWRSTCSGKSRFDKKAGSKIPGNCSSPHWLDKPTTDGKALQQTPHPRDNSCRDWKVDMSEPNQRADAAETEVAALREALEAAQAEIIEHNAEYHHKTAPETLTKIETALHPKTQEKPAK